jgi:hypothetical protein
LKHNLGVTVPYCTYYGLFLSSRAFLLTVPDVPWKGLVSVEMTHQATLNQAVSFLRRLKSDAKDRWEGVFKGAQAQRELFSYRFPASGLDFLDEGQVELDRVLPLCRLLADLAKLNSDCLESSLAKHAKGPFQLIDNDDLALAASYAFGNATKRDRYDVHWLRRFARGGGKVSNLAFMAAEGLIEDFFGAWQSQDGSGFDPDEYAYLLLTG